MHYHILGMHRAQDEATVVFHIDVPDTDNAASVSYRTALVESIMAEPEGTTTSVVPGLASAEQTQLDNGERYEHIERVEFDGNLDNADKKTAIEAAYTARKTQLLQIAQNRLEFWGWSGDVA